MLYEYELCYTKELILEIFEKMKENANIFEKDCEYKINFKKKCVKDFFNNDLIYIDSKLIDSIDSFISIVKMNELESIILNDKKLDLRKREKKLASYVDKLRKYQDKEDKKGNKGAYPINKCLNDLLGYRLIIKNDVTLDMIHENLKSFIEENFNNKVSIYNASKVEYKGLHVYFKPSNFCFPCELQIWVQKDEKNNIESHEIYKREYFYWETYGNVIKRN